MMEIQNNNHEYTTGSVKDSSNNEEREESGHTYHWESSALTGYSPLLDPKFSAMIHNRDNDDDGDRNENHGNLFYQDDDYNTYGYNMITTYLPDNMDSDEEPDNEREEDTRQKGVEYDVANDGNNAWMIDNQCDKTDDKLDYHTISANALSLLDMDYYNTIQSEHHHSDDNNQSIEHQNDETIENDHVTLSPSDDDKNRVNQTDEIVLDNSNAPGLNLEQQYDNQTQIGHDIVTNRTTSNQNKTSKDTEKCIIENDSTSTSRKMIDIEAVTRVMSIIQDTNDTLQSKYEKWQMAKRQQIQRQPVQQQDQQQEQQQRQQQELQAEMFLNNRISSSKSYSVVAPKVHSIIPKFPLLSFRKKHTINQSRFSSSDENIITVTDQYSRSACIAEALARCHILSSKLSSSSTIIPNHQFDNTSDSNYFDLKASPSSSLSLSAQHMNNTIHNTTLTIDIIGCDQVECESTTSIQKYFSPVASWIRCYFLHHYQQQQYQFAYEKNDNTSRNPILHIVFNLIGPNIPSYQNDVSINLLSNDDDTNSKDNHITQQDQIGTSAQYLDVIAYAYCYVGIYDEFVLNHQPTIYPRVQTLTLSSQNSDNASNSTILTHSENNDKNIDKHHPDLVIAFNAGVWGYGEWGITIRSLCEQRLRQLQEEVSSAASTTNHNIKTWLKKATTPFIFTAYTLEESEDDHDVIEQVVKEYYQQMKMTLQQNKNGTMNEQSSISSTENGVDKNHECLLLWGPQMNPYSSQKHRITYSASSRQRHNYYENSAWQGWSI